MLSSIHPLGERARDNNWTRAVIAFTVGTLIGGTFLAVVLGSIGALLFDSAHWGLAASFLLLAGAADLGGLAVPGPSRQVNEGWIGTYRDWVYGAGFGLQLGVGFSTFVVTWGTWAVALAMLLVADPRVSIIIGLTFGLGRALTLWSGVNVRRPEHLISHARVMAQLARPARVSNALLLAIVGGVVLWSS